MATEVEQAPAEAVTAAAEPALDAPDSNGAAEAAADASRPPRDYSWDSAHLVMHKGRARKPTRPDDSERNAQVGKLQEQIDKASARIKEIKGILDSRGTGGQRVMPPEQAAIREKQGALRGEWDTLLLQKKRLLSQNDDKRTEIDKLFAEQRSIRDTVRGPSNLATLDAAIAEAEFKLTHESLSAAQEKALRERKERMERQDRPAVARLAAVAAAIDEAKAASAAIRKEITQLDGQLDAVKAARQAQDAKLIELRAADAEARSDIPALQVEKKELWEVISALRDKQREIRLAFNAKWDEFKAADRAYRGWAYEERKKRNEQRKKDWEERQAARKEADGETKPAKFEMEVYTCEQVLSYLRQYVPADKAAPAEAKPAADVDAPAPGMKLLAKRNANEDSLYAGMGSKKGKGARKAAEKQAKAEAVKQLPRVLPLDTLKTFSKLGLAAPKANEDVPRAIEAVQAKKAEFEAKRDKAVLEPESEPEEEPEEEEAAPEEPAAAESESSKAGEAEVGEAAGAPHANGSSAHDVDGGAAGEANGDVVEAVVTAAGATAAAERKAAGKADALAVKLRVTDDGEVNLEVTA